MMFHSEAPGGENRSPNPPGANRVTVKTVVLLCHFCRRAPLDHCLIWPGRERRKFLGCARCVAELKQLNQRALVVPLKDFLALDPKKVDAWFRQRRVPAKGRGPQ